KSCQRWLLCPGFDIHSRNEGCNRGRAGAALGGVPQPNTAGELTTMLTAIVRSSLRRRGVVVTLACLLLGYGAYSLKEAKYDVFPEFSPPEVVIPTESPGLSPEQVELLVTQPIENAVNGMSGVQSLRSTSTQGLSVVTVLFSDNTNIYLDRQVV